MKQCCALAIWVVLGCAFVAPAADTYDSLTSRAAQALTAKQYSNATSLAEKAIALNPARLDAYLYAAKGYDAQRLFDHEIGMLQRALSHAPAEKKQLIREAIAQARKSMAAGGGRASAAPAGPAPSAPTQAEIVLWKSIENSQNPLDLGAYIQTYPNGAFVPLARQRLAGIEAAIRSQQEQQQRAQQQVQEQQRQAQQQKQEQDAAKVETAKQSIAANIRKLGALLEGDRPMVLFDRDNKRNTIVKRLDGFEGCAVTITTVETHPWDSESTDTNGVVTETFTVPFGSLYTVIGGIDRDMGSPFYLLDIDTKNNDIKLTHSQEMVTGVGPAAKREDVDQTRTGMVVSVDIDLRDRANGDQAVRLIRDIAEGCQGKAPLSESALAGSVMVMFDK